MNNLFPATMLFALLLCPQSLSVQSETHCPMTEDEANCVRFFASLGVECEQSLIVDGIGVDDLCRAL